jgi:hypothetical protein
VSLDPEPVIVTEAACCQDEEPPETVGAVGAVRSIMAAACTQPDVLFAPSIAWNRTRVVPWALMVAVAPAVAADQVEPPLVDVWYW